MEDCASLSMQYQRNRKLAKGEFIVRKNYKRKYKEVKNSKKITTKAKRKIQSVYNRSHGNGVLITRHCLQLLISSQHPPFTTTFGAR